MKHFIFSKEIKNKKGLIIFHVYQIKNNKPIYIGLTTASVAHYVGDKSHVMNFLVKEKKLSKKFSGKYYSQNELFVIYEL